MERKFYTIKEISEMLGISRMTIIRKMQQGEIISYKIGKRRLFKKEEIDHWIESQRQAIKK